MKSHISAPAPRMLLRFFQLLSAIKQQGLAHSRQAMFCEIGPGLGDATSLALEYFDVNEAHLYEDADVARKILQNRFCDNEKVHILGSFSITEECYDLLFCFEVIEHIKDDVSFIGDICTSIKPGGQFIGSVPAYMNKWQDVDELAGHFRRYERLELIEKLKAGGFEDIRIYCYGFPLINVLYPLRKLYYGSLLKRRNFSDKATATSKSGVSRGFAQSFNTTFVLTIVRLFSPLQSLPLLSRLGDGFVFTCRRS